MADPAIVTEWLEKADEDFQFATANLRDGSEFYAQLCFQPVVLQGGGGCAEGEWQRGLMVFGN